MSNSEIVRLADQLRRAFEGDAWHGPAVLEILRDVDAAAAARRSIPDAHTIWELTLHVAGWEGVVLRRLRGHAATLEGQDNFPIIRDTSESAWHKTMEELKLKHQELLNELSSMPDSRLSERVPGKNYDVYFMLQGAVQHELYHAGQMAILKKVSA